jgi:hypothetical protein
MLRRVFGWIAAFFRPKAIPPDPNIFHAKMLIPEWMDGVGLLVQLRRIGSVQLSSPGKSPKYGAVHLSRVLGPRALLEQFYRQYADITGADGRKLLLGGVVLVDCQLTNIAVSVCTPDGRLAVCEDVRLYVSYESALALGEWLQTAKED